MKEMSFDKKKKSLDSTKSSTTSMVFSLRKKDSLEDWIEYQGTHIAGKFTSISITEITMGTDLSSTAYVQSKMIENPLLEVLPIPANQLSQEQQLEVDEIRNDVNDAEIL